MESLFVQTLMVCAQAGLVKLGRVALDGAKVKANASRHKAMSYDRMQEEEARLQQEIAELMAKADAADADDDEQFGDRHGEELPDELARRQSRLEKIREAREALEAAAKQKAEDHIAKMETEGRNHRTDPEQAVPDDKAQRNFTDPESKFRSNPAAPTDPNFAVACYGNSISLRSSKSLAASSAALRGWRFCGPFGPPRLEERETL